MDGQALTLPLLICDMGSSSGKWVFFPTPDEIIELNTPGISPVHTPDALAMEVLADLKHSIPAEPAVIHYFGTGCYHLEPRMKMQQWLKACFPFTDLRIRSDLESAAIATMGRKDGWIAILGTGSSLARWQNGELSLIPPEPGDHNDPGSGTAIGNMLLQSYFYGDLPSDLRSELVKDHPEIAEFEAGLIQSQHPDRIIASYAQWVVENAPHHEFLAEMIKKALSEFIEKRIVPSYDSTGGAVHFNGSIAWHARKWLTELLGARGISMGKIVVSPLEGVVAFYKEDIKYGKRH